MESEIFLEMSEFIQPVTFIIVTMIGWGVRAIWSKVNGFDKKIDDLRIEMHKELQEYERKETCRAHREALLNRVDSLAALHGVCMTKSGLAFCNINDRKQMRELHELLTPDERKFHAEQCQFKQDMTGGSDNVS